MSEFKGSKSPWSLSDESEKWNRIVDAEGNLITTCYAMQNEDDANANLIAAAPELLKSLKCARLVIEKLTTPGSTRTNCLAMIDAALLKALGQ